MKKTAWQNLFHFVCRKGYKILMEVTLSHIDVNAELRYVAHITGNKLAAELLINHGADVNASDNEGFTALMFASAYGRLDVVEMLLDCGAHINTANVSGQTALMLASSHGCLDVVELLCARGAYLNIADNDGWTAVVYALTNDQRKVADFLKAQFAA